MLQRALDTWLWLLFPAGAALVGFAFFGAAKAWRRWSKNRETTSPTSSLPAQVRNARSRSNGTTEPSRRSVTVILPADAQDKCTGTVVTGFEATFGDPLQGTQVNSSEHGRFQ